MISTGFDVRLSSIQANRINAVKICYITKNPSYTDLFYIETYRYSGSPFTVIYHNPYNFTFALSPSLPIGSIPNIIQRTYLNAFNFESTVTNSNLHIDTYPISEFPN